jgi:hypothetical protein
MKLNKILVKKLSFLYLLRLAAIDLQQYMSLFCYLLTQKISLVLISILWSCGLAFLGLRSYIEAKSENNSFS